MNATRNLLAAVRESACTGESIPEETLRDISHRMEARLSFRDAVLATLLFDVSLDFACAMVADSEGTSGELGDIMTKAWNEGVPSAVVERLENTRNLLDAMAAVTVSDAQPAATHAYILWWLGFGDDALRLADAALGRDPRNMLARLVRASVSTGRYPDYLEAE